MKVSKGQSQPEIVTAAFLVLYMVLGRPFQYRVLIVTHMEIGVAPKSGVSWDTMSIVCGSAVSVRGLARRTRGGIT